MSEPRLVDANDLKNTLVEYHILDEAPMHVAATVEQYIDEQPTIDPETLPIVQELREKLSRYEQTTNTENIYYMLTDAECPAWFYDNEQTLKIAKYLSKNCR